MPIFSMATGMTTPAALSPLAKALGNLSSVAVTTSGSLTHLASTPFNALHRAIGAIQSQIVSLVQWANPAAVIRFKMAWEDLQGVLGRILLPVLNNVTLAVQKLADYLNAASGPAKGFAAILVTVGVVAAAVTGGFIGMTGALIVLKLAMDVFTGGITAVIGLIGAALGAAAAGGIGAIGMGLAVTPFEQLKGIIDQIGPPLLKIFEMIGSAVMDFAGGALPGLMNAIQAIVAAVNTVIGSLPGAGNVFELIGQHVGTFVQFLATAFQFLATVAAVVIDAFRSLGQILFGNVDILSSLSRGFEKTMAILKAISMVLSGEEGEGETGKPPPKAPPAIRQATSQNIQSFITKAYVSAFQVGAGEDGTKQFQFKSLKTMEEINKSAKAIATDIREFLDRVQKTAEDVQDRGTTIGNAAGNIGTVSAFGPGTWAMRQLFGLVTGK